MPEQQNRDVIVSSCGKGADLPVVRPKWNRIAGGLSNGSVAKKSFAACSGAAPGRPRGPPRPSAGGAGEHQKGRCQEQLVDVVMVLWPIVDQTVLGGILREGGAGFGAL